jgi:hypothetical protein
MMKSLRSRYNKLTVPEMIGIILGVVVLVVGVVAFQAWLLGIVLGWFGVNLAFWQNAVIVLLIGMLFGSRSSSK